MTNPGMAAGGRGSWGPDAQRRPVALVVIVQIQRLCSGGGGSRDHPEPRILDLLCRQELFEIDTNSKGTNKRALL